MAKRNSIFRKVVQNLEKDGLDHHEAVKMAQKAVRSRNGNKHFQPDGHGSNFVRPITIVDDVCTQTLVNCDSNSNFRRIDGKCNNLQNPYWGAMSVAFSREIAVDTYDPKSKSILLDEDDEMITKMNRKKGKGSKGGNSGKKSCPKRGTLPSARFVSHTFHTSENISSTDATHMLTQWGQFLDHDLTLTPENEEHGCCEDNTADECFPILVPSNDSFYQSHSVNCLEFARSVAHCEENGGTRQQTNAITSFVDASNVYGSDNDTAVSLRSLVDGKLLIEDNELLPQVDGEEVAGDTRALEMPGLATMHTLFVREHNRLCDLIKAARPGWNDEEIYQNARRILIAEYQSITYGGFLPVVLGSKNMNNLKLSKKGSKYKPEVNPTMTNEFATASFRFGHSMIQGLIKLFHTDNSGQFDEYFLHENFFNMYTYRESMENILMGLITQPAQEFDKEITSETTNLLFPEEGHSFGSDLAARNIQRGRDHGLPGFCCYYKLYDDKKHNCKKGWGKKYRNISPKNWALLKTIYDHPKDIDLFTGLLAQKSHNGALGGKVIMKMKSKFF